jgi:hypothetical protein
MPELPGATGLHLCLLLNFGKPRRPAGLSTDLHAARSIGVYRWFRNLALFFCWRGHERQFNHRYTPMVTLGAGQEFVERNLKRRWATEAC